MTALITATVALWNPEFACESWEPQRREHLNPNLKERVIDWCTARRGQRKQCGQTFKCDKTRRKAIQKLWEAKRGLQEEPGVKGTCAVLRSLTYLASDGAMKGFWVEQWGEGIWVSEGLLPGSAENKTPLCFFSDIQFNVLLCRKSPRFGFTDTGSKCLESTFDKFV